MEDRTRNRRHATRERQQRLQNQLMETFIIRARENS